MGDWLERLGEWVTGWRGWVTGDMVGDVLSKLQQHCLIAGSIVR